MARTAVPVTALSGFGGASTGAPSATMTAADATNDHQFTHPGGQVELDIRNGSVSAMTVTVKAVATNRTMMMAEDLTVTVPANEETKVNIPDRGYDAGGGVVEFDIDQDTSSYVAVRQLLRAP